MIYAQLPTEEQRMEKIRQRAAKYVNSVPQMRITRRLQRLERRMRRIEKGLNAREQDVVVRWNARKQQRMLQQHVQLCGDQTTQRKM